MYTCRAREETRERSSGRAGDIDSRGWLAMATTLPMSRLVSPSSDSRVSRAYRYRPVLTTPDRAGTPRHTILSSSPRRSGRVTRGASETDATTQHNNEDNEKEGDEKALVGDRPYRLVNRLDTGVTTRTTHTYLGILAVATRTSTTTTTRGEKEERRSVSVARA